MRRRLLLFLLFASLGVGGLVKLAGGLGSTRSPDAAPEIVVHTPEPSARPNELALQADGNLPLRTSGGRDVTVQSSTETLVFEDPGSGARREILGWFTWRFRCARFEPLPGTGGSSQGVRCEQVVLELYRAPRTLTEADARIAGKLEAVLHQRMRADEAVAIGSLARELRRTEGIVEGDASTRSVVHLAGNVELEDLEQWIEVTGNQLTVYPNQGRVEGEGPFRVVHEALTLTGDGLEIDRAENGWSRVRVVSQPHLHIHGDLRDGQGRAVFGFGGGEMRPTDIVSDGEALLVREAARNETRLRVQFPHGVRAEQTGGQFLEAGWLELLAVREGPPREQDGDMKGRWSLRELHGDKGVKIDYRKATADGRTYLGRLESRELMHLVPPNGAARTELEGQPRIVIRGDLSLGTLSREGDRILATARDRAWIEPVDSALGDPDHDPASLRRIVLEGSARLARQNPELGVREDTLSGERIEFIVHELAATDTTPAETTVTTVVAEGDVRIGSPWIEGTTPRLVLEALDSQRPRIAAIGVGTAVTLPLLREDQGLLGADKPDPSAPGSSPAPASRGEGRWTVRRLLARDDVEIQTEIGGASVGLPTWVLASEAFYEEPASTARLVGRAGAPARIRSRVAPGQDHEIEAPLFTLDRAAGRIAAHHGVRGTVWTAESEGGDGLGRERDVRPARSLTLRTDARIDVALVRGEGDDALDTAEEQSIRIEGPVTAELRSASLVVDRLRAGSLDIVLGHVEPSANTADTGSATAPFARMFDSPASPPGGRAAPATPARPVIRQRVDISAGDIEVQLTNGEVAWLDATGGVDLSSAMGRVSGARMRYTGALHRVDVLGDSSRRAGAWLGAGEARTEIEAARLGLVWRDGVAERADATADEGQTARIRLFRRDAERPERLERYVIQYRGTIQLLPNRLDASDVVVERTVRTMPEGTTSAPAILMAKTLEVTGSSFLSREAVDVQRMVASGPDTFFQAGDPQAPVRIWGTRFDFDVPRAQAELTGPPPRGVTLQKADEVASDHARVVIDLRDGLPLFLDGSRILWRPQEK
ncbi:MAG: hypothetical protein H6805_11600 [Planctomycetes bacterium]|nr:hypothetical protein [Planctomycetota bacterium]